MKFMAAAVKQLLMKRRFFGGLKALVSLAGIRCTAVHTGCMSPGSAPAIRYTSRAELAALIWSRVKWLVD